MKRQWWVRLILALILLLIILWLIDRCPGKRPPDDPQPQEGKIVFVSSQLFNGNFGAGQKVLGHLEADQRCQGLATEASLSGSFKAWVSCDGVSSART